MLRPLAVCSVSLLVAACAGVGVVSESARPQGPAQYPGQLAWTYPDGATPGEVVAPEGLSLPNPASERLAGTRTAMQGGEAEGRVAFCVGPVGSVASAESATSTGDAELDRVLRDAVLGWTFEPALRSGQPVRACATATFALSFR